MSKTVEAYIEIPRGSRNKYEFDFDRKVVMFDRMLYTSMKYPADYGFIPETLALDNDPLDVLVLFSEPTFPGCVAEVIPVGVLNMSDDKGDDEKILCVPKADPIMSKIKNFSDVNDHTKDEIAHFFEVYKDLENKECDVREWGDEKDAQKLIDECRKRYEESDKTFEIC